MLFGGAQYEDDPAGVAPPRKKKVGRSGKPGSARRDKRASTPSPVPPPATSSMNGNGLSRSYESTTSSSSNSLTSFYLQSHQANQNNYNYNALLASASNGGVAPPAVPIGGTPPAPKPRRLRESTTRVKRTVGIFKLRRPIDRQCMYPTVWKTLKFRKKMVVLASNLSVKPICVTGVDGFLASWIVSELLSRGYRVRGTVQNRQDDISGLLALPNAADNFTVVETSLLTPEACDLAVQGCDFVIHTGTPSSCSVRDPLSEQQEPGVHSIGSRMHCIIPMMTNFIQACARARIKRVVLTSSISAMTDSVGPDSIINDASWNVVSSLEKNPHFLSLKLAEEAAWQLVDQLPRDRKIDLVTMNPGTLFGPALSKAKLAPGNQFIYDLITGQYSALVDLNWSMIDVRDCAAAHIAALENNDARGRYICVSRTVWMREVVDILANNGYSGRDLPWRVGLPAWIGRLPAYSLQLGQVGAALYTADPNSIRASPYLSEKVVDHLNVNFRSIDSTVVESANDLLKWGLIKPWAEDHEAFECGCCHRRFSFYRRKHHCRECGVIICNECSMSRAIVEGTEGRARVCDKCVKDMIPDLLELLRDDEPGKKRTAVTALESLMENTLNHDYVTRFGGILLLMDALHHPDESISSRAAGALCALTLSVDSTLQMVLEGAVLQMLEVDEGLSTWGVCLQALRNIWKQINRQDFRKMLHAVARVSADADIGELRGNILLTFVHMMDTMEVPSLLSEGLLAVLHHMLQSGQEFPRCAAAHAIKHLVPPGYDPDLTIDVPAYLVDDHEELFLNSSLSDLQFLVKGHIAPINAHKVVLFFRNSYFKNMVRFGSATSQTAVIEVDNCTYEVFSILLRFLYTGKVDITPDIAEELLRASSHYCVFELQKRCEAFLSNQITVDNVVDYLSLADECHADDLKKNCIPFLMRHIHDVVRLPAFELHRVRSSEEVLKALVTILGPEWEASYEAFKSQSTGSSRMTRPKRATSIARSAVLDANEPIPLNVTPPPTSSPRAPNEQRFSPKFLLSPVAPRSFGGNPAPYASLVEPTPVLNPVGGNSSLPFSFVKPFGNEDVAFRRSRGFSEDFSEGLSEGVC